MFLNDACTNRIMSAALCVLATTLGIPTLADAEQITLTLGDGNAISGDLIEFRDDIYVINSSIGKLSLRVDQVTCSGAACPATGDAGPVVWNVSLWGERRAFTEHVEKLAELVAEKTDGKFVLNLSYGDLSPAKENLDGILKGDFEMAQFCAGYHPEKNPSLNVLELPFLGVSTMEQELAASYAVYQHPYTISDMARWNATLLMPSPQPQQNIMGTGQPPMSLADFKGMSIRATGGIGDAVAALGATPVSMAAPATAVAMKSGEVRAVSFAPHAHMAFGIIDAGTWWTTNLNPGTANCPVVANTTALEKLSPENREALMSSLDDAVKYYVDNYENVTMKAWYPALQEKGIIELTFSDAILSQINGVVAAPTAAAWIIRNEAAGVPAQELYSVVMKSLAQGF